MFAPGKGFLEIGAGGGDGESFIRLSELQFEAVSFFFFLHVCFVSFECEGKKSEVTDEDDDLVLPARTAGLFLF